MSSTTRPTVRLDPARKWRADSFRTKPNAVVAACTRSRRLRTLPDLHVGAGSVLVPHHVDQVVEAGARFVVSPGLSVDVVQRCRALDVPALPGFATASDLMTATALGLTQVEFFPAGLLGGPPAIRALAAPFTRMAFMPSGGVNAGNMADYPGCPGCQRHLDGGPGVAARRPLGRGHRPLCRGDGRVRGRLLTRGGLDVVDPARRGAPPDRLRSTAVHRASGTGDGCGEYGSGRADRGHGDGARTPARDRTRTIVQATTALVVMLEFAGPADLVARFGDEFVPLLPGDDGSQLAALASRVQDPMQEPWQAGVERLPVRSPSAARTAVPAKTRNHVLALAGRSMYSHTQPPHRPVTRLRPQALPIVATGDGSPVRPAQQRDAANQLDGALAW